MEHVQTKFQARYDIVMKCAIAQMSEVGFHTGYYIVDNALQEFVMNDGAMTEWMCGSSYRDWANALVIREDVGSDEHVLELNDGATHTKFVNTSTLAFGLEGNGMAISEAMLGEKVYRSLRVLPLDLGADWRERAPRQSFHDWAAEHLGSDVGSASTSADDDADEGDEDD
jgi:hypothetical protein